MHQKQKFQFNHVDKGLLIMSLANCNLAWRILEEKETEGKFYNFNETKDYSIKFMLIYNFMFQLKNYQFKNIYSNRRFYSTLSTPSKQAL